MAFFLLTENTFHSGYLVNQWLDEFGTDPEFLGVTLRADPLPEEVLANRASFHERLHGRRELSDMEQRELLALYPDAGDTDFAMVKLLGIPARPVTALDPGTATFLGHDLNSARAEAWLTAMSQAHERLHGFVFLDRLLASWWIKTTAGMLFNAHSAVLPHARGMFAIEQVAARADAEYFRRAAGATVHFVDEGVDTGPIVRAERLDDPFAAESIWECKGRSFATGFRLLTEVARDAQASRIAPPTPQTDGTEDREPGPEFKRRDFAQATKAAAERGYLEMRRRAKAGP